jgi:hypothetical protein
MRMTTGRAFEAVHHRIAHLVRGIFNAVCPRALRNADMLPPKLPFTFAHPDPCNGCILARGIQQKTAEPLKPSGCTSLKGQRKCCEDRQTCARQTTARSPAIQAESRDHARDQRSA